VIERDGDVVHGHSSQSPLLGEPNLSLDRHALLQHAFAIVDAHFEPEHQLRPFFGRLTLRGVNSALDEMKVIVPSMPCPPASVKSVTVWPSDTWGTSGSSR